MHDHETLGLANSNIHPNHHNKIKYDHIRSYIHNSNQNHNK